MSRRKFGLILIIIVSAISAGAQNFFADSNVIGVEVSKKLDINDKIFLENKTPFTIVKAAIGYYNQDGSIEPIGTTGLIRANKRHMVKAFDDNNLKKLKGKKLAIKVKAVKMKVGDEGFDGDLDEIDPSLITYDFNVTLSEQDHDLYITLREGSNTFDF